MWVTTTASTGTTACTNQYIYWTTTSSATTACTNIVWSNQSYASQAMYNQAAMAVSRTYQAAAAGRAYESSEQFLLRESERQAKILAKHADAAKHRARELLLQHLTAEQRHTFEKNGWFVVEGSKSKRKYKITANDNCAANIYVLDGEKVKHRICGHCKLDQVPLADHLLAQKVMLECDEDSFLKIANRHAA